MMEENLLDFFKLLVDADRIRIAALLLERSCSPDEIAVQLRLRGPDVLRHLAQFEKRNLVVIEGGRYHLDPKMLERLSREVLAGRRPAIEIHSNDVDAADFDRKVVKNYSLPDGHLKEIPGQEKKLQAILRHVVQVFKPGVRYTEKQVNETLAQYHEDTASLRRYLVDRKMIEREPDGTAYWRTDLRR